ncbi:MAG TPA: hypothetical protein VF857_05730 [Spirochaetota bacterium]
MSDHENHTFTGSWNFTKTTANGIIRQENLTIEKIGQTYKCAWRIDEGNSQNDYAGIGMLVDNQLLISRYSIQAPFGGIGLYRQIGDSRSNSALWADTRDFHSLGSGIALRENVSDIFDGSYTVKYFMKGKETASFNLTIQKLENNNLYSLTWAKENTIVLHGIGMINNGQMALAWGQLSVDYELIILNIGKESGKLILHGPSALLSNPCTTEKIYSKC